MGEVVWLEQRTVSLGQAKAKKLVFSALHASDDTRYDCDIVSMAQLRLLRGFVMPFLSSTSIPRHPGK